MLPITEKSIEEKWKTILAIEDTLVTQIMWYIISKQNLYTENKIEKQTKKIVPYKKWNILTQLRPLVRRVLNLFRQTNLKVAFLAINKIQQQLTEKQTYNNPSGIYILKRNTCNGVYVGQSSRAKNVRYNEHIRCIRTNNSTSTYAAHMLENRHEYGTKENTLKLLKACQKETRMYCWEALYIQVFLQQKVLITEQHV